MRLRKLSKEDAPFMLEWMHDPSVVENMQVNFASKTIRDCESFIKMAQDNMTDIHFAVADDNNEYMGTVSLKHISSIDAEFAIVMRKSAMGMGYSKFGMKEIIRYGFEELNLKSIYWCVSPENRRALHFYDRNGYQRIELLKNRIGYSTERIKYYIWYQVDKKQIIKEQEDSRIYIKPHL